MTVLTRICIGLAAAVLTCANAQAAKKTLQMTTEYPATSMPGMGVTTFSRLVLKKTHGDIVVDTSFDASKGIKSADMVEAVQQRKVDLGDAFAGGLSSRYPIFGVSSLPFLADSLTKVQRLIRASRPAYERFLASRNQKLLYITPWPASGIWSKTPIRTAADLKGLSIRTYDDVSKAVLDKTGANAVNISFADAMPRIASGEVNAVLSSGDGGAGRKLWQFLPYFAEINYAMPISVATMNLDVYNSLRSTDRYAIDQAAKETEASQWRRIQDRLKENYDNMRKNGVTIDSKVPLAVKKDLRAAAADAVADWTRKAGPEGAAILQRYQGK